MKTKAPDLQMNEEERLSLRAKMLSWNRGYKTMESALEEFGEMETPLDLAAATIGGCCACLLQGGYDYLTINAITMNALLNAQAAAEQLWRQLHQKTEKQKQREKKQKGTKQ
jgi:hypothetical protein